MAKKYSFPEMQCSSCPDFQCMGSVLFGTRYCGGFPKNRKPKRFKSSDPKYKAPQWCPRRLPTPVCRVYGFADEQSRAMDLLTREWFDPKRDRYISPAASRYKLRLERPLGINAKTFFERVGHADLDDFLAEADISPGEVVEIDDGLCPYCFYCLSWSVFVPVSIFDHSGIKK